jgi:hypothetical protein
MTCYKPLSVSLEQNVRLNLNVGELVKYNTMYKHIIDNLTITRLKLSYAIKVVN